MSFPPTHLIADTYMKGGIEIQTNITGKYRLCQHASCEKYIPCPFVKCQEHRTDFANVESPVKAWGE